MRKVRRRSSFPGRTVRDVNTSRWGTTEENILMRGLMYPGHSCSIASNVSPHRDLARETSHRTVPGGFVVSTWAETESTIWVEAAQGGVYRTHDHGCDELYPI